MTLGFLRTPLRAQADSRMRAHIHTCVYNSPCLFLGLVTCGSAFLFGLQAAPPGGSRPLRRAIEQARAAARRGPHHSEHRAPQHAPVHRPNPCKNCTQQLHNNLHNKYTTTYTTTTQQPTQQPTQQVVFLREQQIGSERLVKQNNNLCSLIYTSGHPCRQK